MIWPYDQIDWDREVLTENARLFKGESKKVIIKPSRGGEGIRDIFWHSDTGDPIFISRLKQNIDSTDIRNSSWEVTVHNPFGNDVYVEIFGLQEMISVWVDVDTIGDPEPFIQLLNKKQAGSSVIKEYWKYLDKHVKPSTHTNPIDVDPFQTTQLIRFDPTGPNRRLREIYWTSQYEDDLVLLGLKKRNIADGSLEIKLHNSSNRKTQISVYGIEEEYVGKIKGEEI